MDLEPFKNKDGSIYKKEKIGFIWARIKLAIRDEIKRIGALSRLKQYAESILRHLKRCVKDFPTLYWLPHETV